VNRLTEKVGGTTRTIVVAVICALVVGATGAVAADLITGKDIKNNSIAAKDLKKKLRKKIGRSGTAGAPGQTGPQGTQGPQGPAGPAGADAVALVTSLVPDETGDGPAPPAWGERVSAGCGSGTGDANVDGDTLEFNLPDAAGSDAVGANFNGFNGLTLADLSEITYHAKYEQTGADQHGGTPYFRIFTEGFDHAVIFSPNTQPGANIDEGEWQKFDVVNGGVRYDDDAGNNPDISWEQLIDDHGTDEIAQIRIQAGCAGAYSAETVAQADNLTVVANGQRSVFDFGGAG
jgi:hypothetical protein